MQNISLFKLSRYFIIWFLLITVVPLLSLLLWSDYGIKQSIIARHKQFLELYAADSPRLFAQYLASELRDIERITGSLPAESTTLNEYKILLNANQIFWLDSPESKSFMREYPELAALQKVSSPKSRADYLIMGKKVESAFVIPVKNAHRALLLTQSVPLDFIVPQGPVKVEVYVGRNLMPANLIFKSHHPDFGHPAHPHGPGTHGSGAGGSGKLQGNLPPPLDGGFSPMPPPAPQFDKMRACLSGNLPQNNPDCKPLAEKMISVTNQSGAVIAKMRLLALPPPPPPPALVDASQWMSVFILVAGLLMSLLMGNYIRQNFVEPLINLSVVARKVQGGNLSSRINTLDVRHQDVRQTLESVNLMLDGLIEKEQLRNSFISNLTHDFRTPLIAEQRALELLVREFRQLGLGEQVKLAIGILKNNEHLLTMVNQLLETYQTEAGMFDLKLAPVSIPGLLDQCFEQLASLAEERNVSLSHAIEANVPEIMADGYYLKRVLINLIGNALENIPKGSQIQLLGNRDPHDRNMVEIHVRDNGPGIPKDDREHLFDRYYAGTGDTRKLGSGLGLYICKVLVTAHQGSIAIDSEEGRYTDFIIRLPITRKEEQA